MTSKEDLIELKDVFLTIKQEWLEDKNAKLTKWQNNIFDSLEKDLDKLKELYKTILEKKENALNDFLRTAKEYDEKSKKIEKSILHYEVEKLWDKIRELKGEIEAYTDILCLIESSGEIDGK